MEAIKILSIISLSILSGIVLGGIGTTMGGEEYIYGWTHAIQILIFMWACSSCGYFLGKDY